MASPTVSVTSQSVGVPDNTPITNPVTLPEEPRSGQNYIDTYDPLKEHDERDWQDSPDEDEDDIYDEYDENRVEDEDWEVAEKGAFSYLSLYSINHLIDTKTLQNSTIDCDNTSQCIPETLKVTHLR